MGRAQAGDDGGGMIRFGTGTVIEDEGPVRVLLQVDYDGAGSGGASGRKYFAVEGEINASTAGIPVVDLAIAPITEGDVLNGHETRYLPIQIMRELDLGIQAGAVIQVIGWSAEREVSLGRVGAFARVAADVLGARVMALSGGIDFAGLQLGHVEVEAGLEWDLSARTRVRVSVGEEAAGMAGVAAGSGSFGVQSASFAQVQVPFRALSHDFAFFIKGEYERLVLWGGGAENIGDLHLIIGVGGEF